jgi:hypothetical protein
LWGRVGEGGIGSASRCGLSNRFNNAFQIPYHVVIRKSKNCVALRCEPAIARPVTILLRHEVVRFAVDFYREASAVADEIGDVAPHRDLPSEPEAVLSIRF